jgi:hypothetical protein
MSRLINQRGRIYSSRFSQLVQFERAESKYGDDGNAHETREQVTLQAIVQPAGKDDLELLEEGQRYKPTKLVHTASPLTVGDYMFFEGYKWRIVNSQDWSSYGYYHSIAIRYDGTEASDSDGYPVT